jgi:hypothetical protein
MSKFRTRAVLREQLTYVCGMKSGIAVAVVYAKHTRVSIHSTGAWPRTALAGTADSTHTCILLFGRAKMQATKGTSPPTQASERYDVSPPSYLPILYMYRA